MASKPIIFSTPMVQAILNGRKTQTRRAVNMGLYCMPGDILWVRETYCYHADTKTPWYGYKADGDFRDLDLRWKPSIHMPREASRILLRVMDVDSERVQDISIEDCIAEGYPPGDNILPQEWFKSLWDSLNAKRGYGWDANPWVWDIRFVATVVAPARKEEANASKPLQTMWR